jgi:hypothetical protein
MRHRRTKQRWGHLRRAPLQAGRALRRWQRRVAAYLWQEGRLWLWFGSALCGVLAQSFFEATQAGHFYRLSWPRTAVALVATLLTFQATFERYKDVGDGTPLLVQVSLAFQCGFFWQTVFNDLTGLK